MDPIRVDDMTKSWDPNERKAGEDTAEVTKETDSRNEQLKKDEQYERVRKCRNPDQPEDVPMGRGPRKCCCCDHLQGNESENNTREAEGTSTPEALSVEDQEKAGGQKGVDERGEKDDTEDSRGEYDASTLTLQMDAEGKKGQHVEQNV